MYFDTINLSIIFIYILPYFATVLFPSSKLRFTKYLDSIKCFYRSTFAAELFTHMIIYFCVVD